MAHFPWRPQPLRLEGKHRLRADILILNGLQLQLNAKRNRQIERGHTLQVLDLDVNAYRLYMYNSLS
jgi:hypothetical protein